MNTIADKISNVIARSNIFMQAAREDRARAKQWKPTDPQLSSYYAARARKYAQHAKTIRKEAFAASN
jgi:hypothetical protein